MRNNFYTIMSKTATVNSRIDPGLKKEAELIFRKVGLSASEAITLFYAQVTLNKGLPVSVRIPNKTTQEAMEEAERGDVIAYNTLNDLKAEYKNL